MGFAHKFTVELTTAADGSVTGYTPVFSGYIEQIRYVKDGSNGFATGVDFALTVEGTGEGVWTELNVDASATRAPRQATHDVVGAAALYAAGGAAVLDRIAVAKDRVKIAITNGGNAKVGTFYVLIECSGIGGNKD